MLQAIFANIAKCVMIYYILLSSVKLIFLAVIDQLS